MTGKLGDIYDNLFEQKAFLEGVTEIVYDMVDGELCNDGGKRAFAIAHTLEGIKNGLGGGTR